MAEKYIADIEHLASKHSVWVPSILLQIEKNRLREGGR